MPRRCETSSLPAPIRRDRAGALGQRRARQLRRERRRRRRQPRGAAGRGRLPHGPQRRRQDDADEGDHGHPAAPRRQHQRSSATTSRRWPSYQRARAGIGYVPQGRGIFPYLSVMENILVGLEPVGAATTGQAGRGADAVPGAASRWRDARPACSRAASSSSSPSRAPSWAARSSCCWTSRRRASSHHRGGDPGVHRRRCGARCRSCWSSSSSTSPWRWATTATSWSRAASCWRATGQLTWHTRTLESLAARARVARRT